MSVLTRSAISLLKRWQLYVYATGPCTHLESIEVGIEHSVMVVDVCVNPERNLVVKEVTNVNYVFNVNWGSITTCEHKYTFLLFIYLF